MTSPLVSVLITVFNRERYLAAAVDSVLAQTMQDFEIIVVDDLSTDGSVDIARSYAARDKRIRFYSNERNLGDYPNRNRAASFAAGRFLKYVDADDMLYPHTLSLMVSAMGKWPEAGLGLSWSVIDPPQPYPFVSSPREVLREHFLGQSILGAGPSAAIIRRDAFNAVGGFSGRQFLGDIELWLELSQRWPVISVQPALAWWRRHDAQQMCLEQTRPEIINQRQQLQFGVLESTGFLEPAEKRKAWRRLRHRQARMLVSLAFRERQWDVAYRLWSEGGLGWRGLISALRRPVA